MEKMSKKRTTLIKHQDKPTGNEETKTETEEVQIHSCTICGEELLQADLLKNPYGCLGEVNQTKLFFHSKKHTHEKMKERYSEQIPDAKFPKFDSLRKSYFHLSEDQSNTYI
jgi:hypothetical protein